MIKLLPELKTSCKFDGCFTVNSVGASGGLCLLWKDKDLVSINSYSNNHIDSTIKWNGRIWRFSGVYGYPEAGNKHQTWNLIRCLDRQLKLPWLIGGDLNEILDNSEKLGGPRRDRRCLEEFKEVLDECKLRDIKPPRDQFTWHSNRNGCHVWERLDRFFM